MSPTRRLASSRAVGSVTHPQDRVLLKLSPSSLSLITQQRASTTGQTRFSGQGRSGFFTAYREPRRTVGLEYKETFYAKVSRGNFWGAASLGEATSSRRKCPSVESPPEGEEEKEAIKLVCY